MNNVGEITRFTFLDNNFNLNRNAINTTKKAHKMSVIYFKGGSVYFHLSFLVGIAFNVTIWISRRKKFGYSFLIFRSSKLDFIFR